MPISPEAARRALAEREHASKHVFRSIRDIKRRLSKKQAAFVMDRSRRKVAITSRQSGKTECDAIDLIDTALEFPGSISGYFAPTRHAARSIIWERLKNFNEQHALGFTFNEVRLEATAVNRSIIRLAGVPDKPRADRQRGQTLKRAIVDECGSFPDELLGYLVTDILEPALLVQRGWLSLTSTPGLRPSGYLHRAAHDPAAVWSRHGWTLHDNPAVKDVDAYLAEKLADNAWTHDTPVFMREYLGLWAVDLDSQVYRVGELNYTDDLPQVDHTIIGVDFGFIDETAFVVIGWREHDPVLYVLHVESHGEKIISDVADRLRELRNIFQPITMVADTGGLGRSIVAELAGRHNLLLEAAEKRDKPAAIRAINSDFRRELIKVEATSPIVQQWQTLRWHPDYIGLKEQDGIANDLCDAFAYAFRKARHFTATPKKNTPTPGTTDAHRARARAMLDARQGRLVREEQEQQEAERIDDEYDSYDPYR
jgi:hypothetical protein